MNEGCAMNRFLGRLVVFSAVLLSVVVPGRSWGAANDKRYWKTQVDSHLIEEMIYSDGELIMATSGGLLFYDLSEARFENMTTDAGLVSNSLSCLVLDTNGSLWVGTHDAGMMKIILHPGEPEVTPLNALFHGLSDNHVNTVAAWGDTVVYGTEHGAGLIIKSFPAARYFVRHGLPNDYVNDVLPDGDRVWIATQGGVAILDRDGYLYNVSGGLPDPNVRALDTSGAALWAGTFKGVAAYDPLDSTWAGIGLARKKIFSLHYDGSRLWAGSNDSLYVYDGAHWSGFTLKPFLDKYAIMSEGGQRLSEIRAMLKAPDGLLYLGLADYVSYRTGLNPLTFDGVSQWQELPLNALCQNHILRLSLDTDGSIWVGTKNYGAAKLMPSGTWVNYSPATTGGRNLSTRYDINGVLVDAEGTKWLSGINGPVDELHDGFDADYSNDVWVHHVKQPGVEGTLVSYRTVRMKEDPSGNRWNLSDAFSQKAPQEEWGIQILSQDKSEWLAVNPLSTNQGIEAGDVYDVAFGPEGVVYVAVLGFGVQMWLTGGYEKEELFDLSDDSWLTVGRIGKEFPSSSTMQCLALADDGTLWVGTTAGLFRFATNGETKFIGPSRGLGIGLLGAYVNDVLLDNGGNLWVATDLGLNRIAKDDFSDIMAFTTAAAYQQDLFLYYADPDKVISPLAHALCDDLELDRDRNLLYIGTFKGLSVFDISGITPAETRLSNVYCYPNPVRAYAGDTELRIANIYSPVTVEVYNLEGELVDKREADPQDIVAWDLLTSQGFLAASGIYIIRISDGTGHITKKISLIR
jgi:ligand-binding sensor domain-containing protein